MGLSNNDTVFSTYLLTYLLTDSLTRSLEGIINWKDQTRWYWIKLDYNWISLEQ